MACFLSYDFVVVVFLLVVSWFSLSLWKSQRASGCCPSSQDYNDVQLSSLAEESSFIPVVCVCVSPHDAVSRKSEHSLAPSPNPQLCMYVTG